MERWRLNLYSIWFAQILSIMSFSMGMPFMVFYIQELGTTDPEQVKWLAGLLSSGPAVTMAIMAPVWGRLADRFGKKAMLLRAVVAGCIIMFLLGMATQVWQLVVLRMIQGLFTGTVTAAMALVASSAPEKNLGFALGFMASSTAIGNSVGPTIGGLLAEWVGYRYSFLLGSSLLLVNLLVVLFLVKDAPRQPFDRGVPDVMTGKMPKILRPRLRDSFVFSGWFMAAMAILFVQRFVSSIFNPYMPILVQEKLGGLEGAASTTGIINGFISIMMATSGIFLGKLSDRMDRVKLLRIYAGAGCLLAIPLAYIGSHASIWMLMVNYGFMMFFVSGIEPVLMGATTSRINRNQRGTLFGVQALVASTGWALSPILGSWLSIQYTLIAILVSVPMLLGVELLLACTVGNKLAVSKGEPADVTTTVVS